MPTAISGAIGTARQFTPQPDAGYVGRYAGVSPSSINASFNRSEQLSQNMMQLSAALSSYRVSHESYMSDMGSIEAQRMIQGESEESIRKLNAIDAAQQEGFADSFSNPYFKANAERLRGGFLSTVMKNQYDEKYALTPARTAQEEANRYNQFAKDWQKENLEGDSAPVNMTAFSTGFNENQLINMGNLMATWEKKNYENEVTTTMASVQSQLGDVIKEAPELLKTNGLVTQRVQEIFNNVRLMGLPAQYRAKLLNDFAEEFIKTGHIDGTRLSQMMDNITIQTNFDGTEMKASQLLDMMQYKTLASEYDRQFHTQEDYDWIQDMRKKGRAGLKEAMAQVAELRLTDPELARKRNSFIPQINSLVEHDENVARQARYNAARARGRKAGGKGNGTINDPSEIQSILSQIRQGSTVVNGSPINALSFDKDALYGVALPMIQQMVTNGDMEGVSRMMDYSKLKDLRGSISDSLASTIAQIRPSDDGGVNIGGNAELMSFVEAVASNPTAIEHTFGGSLAKEAWTIKTFTDNFGGGEWGFQQGLRLYAESRDTVSKNPELHAAHVSQGQSNIAGYTIDGVANFGNYSDTADFGYNCNRFVASELSQIWTGFLDAGRTPEEAQSAINQIVRQNYGTYHYSVFPKSVYYNMGTDDNARYFKKGLDTYIWSTLGSNATTADAEGVTLTFNPNTRLFDISSDILGVRASVSVDDIRRAGVEQYTKDVPGEERETPLDMDNINAQRSVPKQYNNADSYDDPSILDDYFDY